MKKLLTSISLLFAALWVSPLVGESEGAFAQNPIISGQYSADPTARVFNGKVYLFPSHDVLPQTEDQKKRMWFSMGDYHVFSSDNLTDWTDHGVIVDQNKVPWVKPDSWSMWAPDCVEKNGRYYFYFPSAPKEGRGFGIGVAIANKPEGPYRPMWRPIKGANGIDPSVLIRPNGDVYMYWAGGRIFAAKMKDNMMELADSVRIMQGIPKGFVEGPFVFERNGKIYLTFPWVEEEGGTETLAYCMGDDPLGPFEFKGKIMDKSPTGCWTNHHSIVNFKGQDYLFYHHNDYSPRHDKNRSVRVDKLFFNPDGTIQKVTPTLRGVGITDARSNIQIDRYSSISGQASIDYIDTLNYFDGWKTIFEKGKGTVIYNDVDFGTEPVKEAVIRVKSTGSATAKVFAESNGKRTLVATFKIKPSKDWNCQRVNVSAKSLTSIQNIIVETSTSGKTEIDWLSFDAAPWKKGGMQTGKYRNLLSELGYSQKDIDAKLQECYYNLFEGPNKVYFEVGDDMGYVSDVKNNDVRTEGQSYGMMTAVQFGKKDVFDRLWRWAKKYMQHQSGEREGYFAWSCKTDGTRNSDGPASDGELYYVTSLIFASNLWGNDGEINYLAEAQRILNCSMAKQGMDNVAPFINVKEKLITFTPDPNGAKFTDPSYHLPAFYEVWAKYANDGRSNFWRECAKASREYLHKSMHEKTGLNPDYNNFDGSLMHTGRILGDAFRYDSWRVPMNMALDYSWACADSEWQQQYAQKIQNFFLSQGIDTYVDQYNVDGTQVKEILLGGNKPEYKKLRHSIGLMGTLAAASLATPDTEMAKLFISKFWNAKHEPFEDGYFDAYYDGFLRLFAMMHLSGNYRVITPKDK